MMLNDSGPIRRATYRVSGESLTRNRRELVAKALNGHATGDPVASILRLFAALVIAVAGARKIMRRLRRVQPFDPANVPAARPRRAPATSRRVVLDSGSLQVIHGQYSDAGAGGSLVVHEGSEELPGFANEAIVFLNGWSLEYLGGDHHVWFFASYILNSEVRDGVITWQASGILHDKNGDDPFEWTYYYTVVAWNRQTIRCVADHNSLANGAGSDETTRMPIISTRSKLRIGGLTPPRSTIVLPTGFQYWFRAFSDHHLRHLGFNLSHAATARVEQHQDIDEGGGSVGLGSTTWDTHAIMRDNTYREFFFQHWNTTISGPGASSVQPPFTILPTWREWNIGQPGGSTKTRDIEIRGLTFDHAVPVLAGWDLQYDFDDQHVRRMGVWLDSFEYESPPPTGGTGTLRYRITSQLYDNDKRDGLLAHFNVHVLGFTESQILDPEIE